MAPLSLLQYASELKLALQIAQSIAKEYTHAQYSPFHLLKGILHDDVGLSSSLAAMGKDIHGLRRWAEIYLTRYPKSARFVEQPPGDEQVNKLMEVADVQRLKLDEDQISAFAVLVAMCKPDVAFTPDQLKSFPLNEKELLEAALTSMQSNSSKASQTKGASNNGQSSTGGKKAGESALYKYGVNKTEQAKAGKLDPIIGRDREIQELAKILGRRTKPNVIIVGEPGVGKSALVEGFAQMIVAGKVPTFLQDAALFELDLGTLIAGASYKGEIEERLKSIIHEIKGFDGKAILFIDEIHVLLDPKGSAAGAANLLKPELARGELTVIGATTFDEYRKFILKDSAFERRFDVLKVEEPDFNKAVRMLKILLPKYEKHHEITVVPKALEQAVTFAMRYLKDRQLPDAAVDLVDRTMAAVRMMQDTSKRELELLRTELQQLSTEFKSKNPQDYPAELRWFDSQIRDRISPILLGKLVNVQTIDRMDEVSEMEQYLQETLQSLDNFFDPDKKYVEGEDIASVVAYATGIPVGKLQADEKEKLQKLNDQLRQRVIGQDHALEILANAIQTSRAGLADERRPVGSFFFLGPTGTGKTELAKAIAEFLFNDEKALIRFDMSEFTEKHTVQFLVGAPPGYVGYEEGGALVNQVKERPYSVVLFDEIEKADPEVFKIFLPILDDGKLADKLGKEGDFSNSIVLFTSNVGSDYIVEEFDAGRMPTQEALKERMSKYFKDEFLGRLTSIVPFAPIKAENVVKILDVQLKRLLQTLHNKNLSMNISEEAKQFLATKGFNPRFGARPLRQVIMNELQKPLARMIIAGELQAGQTVEVALKEDSIVFSIHDTEI